MPDEKKEKKIVDALMENGEWTGGHGKKDRTILPTRRDTVISSVALETSLPELSPYAHDLLKKSKRGVGLILIDVAILIVGIILLILLLQYGGII
jgi:hypothetical protein